MNVTTASRRVLARRATVGRLRHHLGAAHLARLALWAGLLHRLARALAAISEELARRTAAGQGAPPPQRAGADGASRLPTAGGAEATSTDDRTPTDQDALRGRWSDRPHPHPRPCGAPQDTTAATERHHGSLSSAGVLTGAPGAAAPFEVGWRAAVRHEGTWANATRARAGTGPTPSRCLLRPHPVLRALRYDAGARCAPRGPWRPLG